jgi:glycosyltransferase involved in cell wall biosynthesis
MTEQALRIGFVTTEYPTEPYTGGIGSYTREMAHSLAGLGHSVVVLLFGWSKKGPTCDGPVRIYRFPGGIAARLPDYVESVVIARKLARLARELDLDVLEAPEWLGRTAFLNAMKPAKLRVVVRLHTCSAIVRRVNQEHPRGLRQALKRRRTDWLERRAILTADVVTAVSSGIREETRRALQLTAADFPVIPNSVSDSVFSSVDNACEPERRQVLFVGRLEWRKGPDLLARAVPAVLKEQPDVCFRFAGGDTLTAPGGRSMRSFLENLLPSSAQSNVEFLGHLASPQLKQVLRSATVCVFPSRYEGLPMVCLEAMASGKAILATDLPGFRELIADGESGLIVKEEDPGALAAGLEKLLSDRALLARLGSNARNVARSRFRGTVVAESMLRIYRAATDFQTSQAELVTTRARS